MWKLIIFSLALLGILSANCIEYNEEYKDFKRKSELANSKRASELNARIAQTFLTKYNACVAQQQLGKQYIGYQTDDDRVDYYQSN